MLKHGWTVICERVLTDQRTNNISLINSIEQITTSVLPAPDLPIALCSYWYREDPKDTSELMLLLRIRLREPDGNEVTLNDPPKEVKIEKPRQRVMANFGLRIKHPGIYTFLIECKKGDDWDTVAELPFDFIYKPEEASK